MFGFGKKKKRKKSFLPLLVKTLHQGKTREGGSFHPNLIMVAAGIVSEYETVLEKNSKMVFGVSEYLLPYSEEDIIEAIDILLFSLKNKNSCEEMKQKYPAFANIILGNEYYRYLRECYIWLAKFISDNEAKIAVKAASLKEESAEEKLYDNLPSLVTISLNIVEKSSSLSKDLINKHGEDGRLYDDEVVNFFERNYNDLKKMLFPIG